MSKRLTVRLALPLLATALAAAGVVAPTGSAQAGSASPAVDTERAARPQKGLKVKVVKPSGVAVKVVVKGPNRFKKRITRTTSFRNAKPGRYRIIAKKATMFDQTIVPRVAPRDVVRVVRHRAGRRDGKQVTVTYRKPALCKTSGTTAYAWGEGAQGTLGTASPADRLRPGPVPNLRGVTQILGGEHTAYALCSDGTVWAWGNNSYGQLGAGITGNRSHAVKVRGLSGITQIAARDRGGIALRNDGTVWTWGWGQYGQLGDGRPFSASRYQRAPVRVAGIADAVQIAAGSVNGFALLETGAVRSWGNGANGRLGNDSNADSNTPVLVDTLLTFKQIAAGHGTTYALESDGDVHAWGDGSQGQLGNGFDNASDVPVPVSLAPAVKSIGASFAAGYAVTETGVVWSWGSGRHHDLGRDNAGNRDNTPDPNVTLANIQRVEGFGFGGYALDGSGRIWGWGQNTAGQVGTGAAKTGAGTAEGISPPGVLPGTGFKYVGAGMVNGYAIR